MKTLGQLISKNPEALNAKLESYKKNLEEKKENRVKSEPLTGQQTAVGIISLIRLIIAIIMIVTGLMFLMSCSSTPEQQLIKKADKFMENEFVKNLKDPSSYQKVSCMVFDTLTVDEYKIMYNKDAGPEFKNGIMHIKISYTYRAKNGFGALDVYDKTIRYFPYMDKFVD